MTPDHTTRPALWAATTHPDLLAAQALLYQPLGFTCSVPQREEESADYGAYTLEVNGLRTRFRVAKITPTKVGQFVTLWKRVGQGPIQPFDLADPVDCCVVSTRSAGHMGQFVFPKTVLAQRDVVSHKGQGGKRAIRVYPPWDHTTSRQAHNTQAWQLDYFLDLSVDRPIDLDRAAMLYSGAIRSL